MKRFGGFLFGHAAKEPALDYSCEPFIELGESIECLVQLEQGLCL